MLNTGLINYTQTSSSVGTNFLKLAANMSTTLQNVEDNNGSSSPLKISTQRIALGTATGTSLLNFPDAGITAADGISFGTGLSNLYRNGANKIATAGSLDVIGNVITWGNYLNQVSTTGIAISPSTLTGSSSTSALSIAQTWNTTGNPTAIFANITNTASGATSNLMDLQVGGVSQFRVNKSGVTRIGNVGGINWQFSSNTLSSSQFAFITGSNGVVLSNGGITGGVHANNTGARVSDNTISIAQVASAVLEVSSTTKGFLPPRMTTAERDLIATPAEGLMIYNTSTNRPYFFNGTSWMHF